MTRASGTSDEDVPMTFVSNLKTAGIRHLGCAANAAQVKSVILIRPVAPTSFRLALSCWYRQRFLANGLLKFN